MKAGEIYKKVINGDSLTDEELAFGIGFFDKLSAMLFDCGPEFRLAASEALNTRNTMYSYQFARRNK